jgi:glyoxylase I family protein
VAAVTPAIGGIDHLSLSVTDLDVSERFYVEVLGFVPVIDFGEVRLLLHRATGLMLGLARHGAGGGRFTERATGLDHLGLSAGSRDELLAWEERLRAAGVEHTPVRDMAFGSHLDFRDPDGIALELSVSSDAYAAALTELREWEVPREEVVAFVHEHLLAAGEPVAGR